MSKTRSMSPQNENGECKLRISRIYARKETRERLLTVKWTGPKTQLHRGNPPCGLDDCKICGVFRRIAIDDIEKAVPGLVQVGSSTQKTQAISPSLDSHASAGNPMASLHNAMVDLPVRTPKSSKTHEPSTISASAVSTPAPAPASVKAPTSRKPTPYDTYRKSCLDHGYDPASQTIASSKHRMITEPDGSAWHPRTVDTILDYLIGERTELSSSIRSVVARKVAEGSKIAAEYARQIQEMDNE